jgi:dynein heavy chain, axonemal
MNSILDDTKKMTLITGESILLNEQIKFLFETTDLSNCSPATISRCGLVCLPDNNISIKAMINHYIGKLPSILNDMHCKLDRMFCYFLPDIFTQFINDDNHFRMIYPVSQKCALQNFFKFFDGFIADYKHEKF